MTDDSSSAICAPQDGQAPGSTARSHRNHDTGADRAAGGEPDWGYLPPEPAGTAQVKRVIPLPLKKT